MQFFQWFLIGLPIGALGACITLLVVAFLAYYHLTRTLDDPWEGR